MFEQRRAAASHEFALKVILEAFKAFFRAGHTTSPECLLKTRPAIRLIGFAAVFLTKGVSTVSVWHAKMRGPCVVEQHRATTPRKAGDYARSNVKPVDKLYGAPMLMARG